MVWQKRGNSRRRKAASARPRSANACIQKWLANRGFGLLNTPSATAASIRPSESGKGLNILLVSVLACLISAPLNKAS